VPERSEIEDLFEVARRDLADAQSRGVSDDWRFAIAYNAALQMARAALLVSGHDVPKGDASHFRAIESLALTIGLDALTVAQLNAYRAKRASSVYDVAGRITSSDTREMLALAQELRRRVERWIGRTRPDLAP
jgi:uncharacterized protein (UPF0332 family)